MSYFPKNYHEDFVTQKEIYDVAAAHGWWEGETNVPEKLALIHSEISEALEEFRLQPQLSMRGDVQYTHFPGDGTINKPEGFAIELADAVIRIRDLCEHFKIDLEKLIREKHEYNKTRPYKHGNKAC